ncbi:uncharacterized protein [Miscanthus floridulus]|uniref:uncharacterized protein n=1 Tax=Miscanthus floridulus TaxID=154761 RepID=UPI00345B29CE
MHVQKNVIESLMSTLMDTGKSKDGLRSWKDMVQLNVIKELVQQRIRILQSRGILPRLFSELSSGLGWARLPPRGPQSLESNFLCRAHLLRHRRYCNPSSSRGRRRVDRDELHSLQPCTRFFAEREQLGCGPIRVIRERVSSRAFRHYVQEHKGRHHPNRKEKLYVKTLCACPKQKPRSLHCGYYTCIMMSTIGGYNKNPNLIKTREGTHTRMMSS